MFCSSFRSLNSLFCCINLVKKLTKDFNDRLRSRVFLNFELKHPSARVCRHFKTNTVHLIDCGFNKRKLHLISSFIIQIWSRRMELRHKRSFDWFAEKNIKIPWTKSWFNLDFESSSLEISWKYIDLVFEKQFKVFYILIIITRPKFLQEWIQWQVNPEKCHNWPRKLVLTTDLWLRFTLD